MTPAKFRNVAAVAASLLICAVWIAFAGQPREVDLADAYAKQIRPLLKTYCFECHSTKTHKGDLDLERFGAIAAVRADLQPWQHVIEQMEVGEMPPKEKPQPTAAERKVILDWTRAMLAVEAKRLAGDPGKVVLRRLNNAELTNTIRDLTDVDLQPARDFPVDSAAGEGFANTGETLTMSPTLLDRYLKSAKDVAEHAVLLPDGFRFSKSTSRRDWSNEVVAKLRTFYSPFSEPKSLERHWAAIIVHREELTKGALTTDALAASDKLNPIYLRQLWTMMSQEKAPTFLLDYVRNRWREADAPAALAEISTLQGQLWKKGKRVAHYSRYFEPVQPKTVEKLAIKLDGGDLVFTTQAFAKGSRPGKIVLRDPRLVGNGKSMSLQDAFELAAKFQAKASAVLRDTDKYLSMVVAVRGDPKADVAAKATEAGLDAEVLTRWIDFVDLPPVTKVAKESPPAVKDTALQLKRLDQKSSDAKKPHVKSWSPKGQPLPVVVANTSEKDEKIPGDVPSRKVAVHPTPTEFVGIAWTSPIAGRVNVSAKIAHAHPTCGNGIVWWLEHRRGGKTEPLGRGAINLGGKDASARDLDLEAGDEILLAIGARDRNHFCDLTRVDLTIAEPGVKGRRWDLADDVAVDLHDGNPHADRLGNRDVWQFVMGADPNVKTKDAPKVQKILSGTPLADWRDAALDPKKADRLDELARQSRDAMVKEPAPHMDGPLFRGIDLAKWIATEPPVGKGSTDLTIAVPGTLDLKLPAALTAGRQFVAEVALEPDGAAPVMANVSWRVGKSPAANVTLLAQGKSPAETEAAIADFQRLFPAALYYPNVIPGGDNEVTLRMYYREDDALVRLMLDADQRQKLDRLWTELLFISQEALRVQEAYPQFMEYVSQDGDVKEFEPYRVPIRKRAEAFQKELLEAEPKQIAALLDFAARAYRRPLSDLERKGLQTLYDGLRKKDVTHDEAFRTVLTRVLVSPKFIYRLEVAPAGAKAGRVTDYELATRLSYFLWATTPDAELTQLAAAGKLNDDKTLAAQAERMLKSPRSRGLATEFGLQWLQVRDILDHKEKSEKLFPTFTPGLRAAFFEESTLFWEDLFQNDRPILNLIDADYAFVNETLAKHYGWPNVKGPQWRKVDGVRKLGRGGVLTLSSVLTKQAGASRTSPILRGNWIVDVLLGEKLPRPPANVPQLPEAEDTSELTMRRLVEQHAKDAKCAHCHQRIDPFGFALERYDPIGRLRDKDLAGHTLDVKVKLRDGVTFEGVDGLRTYLAVDRRDDFVRTFCRKLLGYSLGRSLTLSDQPLVDDMMAALKKNEYRASAAILPIVRSSQFWTIRGRDSEK